MASDIPELPHHPHKASGLPRWLEWTAAISALIISVCSIGIAIYNARIESRILKANSYPYLVAGVSDGQLDAANGAERISVELLNRGVGPADEQSLKIRLGDHYVTDVKDLIRTAVGPAAADTAVKLLVPVYDDEPTRFIASRDRGLIFQIDKTPANARYWDMFDEAMNVRRLTVEFCYCSVFEECWSVKGAIREQVKACVPDPHLEFVPKPRAQIV
ncbi:MAG TPA: hypothetical protein VIC03_03870 [Gemmatimonadaceae bacterium]|jgi:hypothetical protein